MIRSEKRISWSIAFAAFFLLAPLSLSAATMNDYCVQPPFIKEDIKPNLLLIIDNSASMFDLAYSDEGNVVDGNFTRQPYYCYDQTYKSTNPYVGYFSRDTYYSYNFGTNAFEATAGLPASSSCTRHIPNNLCVVHTDTAVSSFVAKGNYLNWLTASKFDVQKEILTGGKYSGGKLIAESRGCVGQSFIKEPNTADFVNYASPETNNPNTGLGITFGIRGPDDSVNSSAPSPGGQTYIDIYRGNYNQKECNEAVTAITSGGNAEIKQAVEECLGSSTLSTVTKTKVVFQQSMQACWQLREGHAIGGDDINTVKNQCTEIYDEYATCSNNHKQVCTTDANCGAGNTCNYGPPAIVPGNPSILCGNEYEGQYYYYQGATSSGTCIYNGAACTTDADCSPVTFKQCKKTDNICTTDADCPGSGNSCFKTIANSCTTSAVSAGWTLIPGTTEAQMIATHTQFCNDMTATPVIDPTDAPSDTSMYDNVPAILSGVGVEAQLSKPIATLTVRLTSASPSGIIQEYANRLRMGLLTFNFVGAASEAPATIATPKVCSTDTTKICTSNIDCPSGGTCSDTVAGASNKDGGFIKHYVGYGHCSTTTATECATDANCPSGELCISDGVGNHATSNSLVAKLDGIVANTWTPFAEAFYNAIGYFAKNTSDATGKTSRTDLRLNTNDFSATMNPSQFRCQRNNIILISDGMSTADRHTSVDNLAKLYTAAGGATSWTESCPDHGGSVNLDNLAWIARNRNINTFSTSTASTAAPVEKNESIKTIVVFTGASNGEAGECNSRTLLSQTATKGGTTLYEATSSELEANIRAAFEEAAGGTSSGTAASILSNNDNNGANLLQAIFYPQKTFTNTSTSESKEIGWIGELQSFWYYIDPLFANSSIREDTVGDKKLKLRDDYVTSFFFDSDLDQTRVNRYRDTDGNGSPDLFVDTVSPESLSSLWKAGNLLWSRNLSTSPRTIKTVLSTASGSPLKTFSSASGDWGGDWATVKTLVQAGSDDEATKIINYIRGADQDGYRDRTGYIGSSAGVWRLGDIISSTPRLQSNLRLNTYNLKYPNGYQDAEYGKYVDSTNYKNRGMAYVGANDGMLHAFNLGILSKGAQGSGEISVVTGSDLGKEMWSFIPKNSLPYLRYLTCKQGGGDATFCNDSEYSHLYYIDLSPFLADVSIGVTSGTGCDAATYWNCEKKTTYQSGTTIDPDNTSWRTILIGGMGLGGASRNSTTSGSGDFVKTPIDGAGYSSYFALDVTDPANPSFLWEFAGDPANNNFLGYATTGPAIVRIGESNKNGRWFAVFASGPTGPIDTYNQQFLGRSNQNLKLFVVDLKSGTLVRTIDTGIQNAFAGSLSAATLDTDRGNPGGPGFYKDDVLYVGYVRKDTDTNTWTKGGVLRVITKENTDPETTDYSPSQWASSKVIDGTGPVTSSIAKLQDTTNKKLWLYFGTGRYFYKAGNDIDDAAGQQAIYGIKEPCYTTNNDINNSCTAEPLGVNDLVNKTTTDINAAIASDEDGWVIDLAAATSSFKAQRVITDPVAASNGGVFFTAFRPNADPCAFGGDSSLWGVRYDTGGSLAQNALQGTALIQVSTGSFKELKLSEAFTQSGGRESAQFTGVPPKSPPAIVSNAGLQPVKKIMHIQER